jgi:hypothetical protein
MHAHLNALIRSLSSLDPLSLIEQGPSIQLIILPQYRACCEPSVHWRGARILGLSYLRLPPRMDGQWLQIEFDPMQTMSIPVVSGHTLGAASREYHLQLGVICAAGLILTFIHSHLDVHG